MVVMNTTIRAGDIVTATTASGGEVRMRALGAPSPGRDFPVVWVATEDEFRRTRSNEDEADGIPWPLAAITAVESPPG